MHSHLCLFVVIKELLANNGAKANVVAEAEIRDAEAKLAEAEIEVIDAEAKVAEAEAKVDAAEIEVIDAEAKVAEAEAKVEKRDAKAEVAKAEAKLNQYPVSQNWINELKERREALKTANETLKRREEALNETLKYASETLKRRNEANETLNRKEEFFFSLPKSFIGDSGIYFLFEFSSFSCFFLPSFQFFSWLYNYLS